VLGGAAVGHGFEPQSILELFSTKILINMTRGRSRIWGKIKVHGQFLCFSNSNFFTNKRGLRLGEPP
jgi:hypothetical protein